MPVDVALGTLTLTDAQNEALAQWGVQNGTQRSTLASAINAAVTVIPTTGSIGAIAANDLIAIDKEVMLVVSKSGSDITVTRGALATTPTTHAQDAPIVKLRFATLRNALRGLLKEQIDARMDESTVAAIAAEQAKIVAARAAIQAIKDAGGA